MKNRFSSFLSEFSGPSSAPSNASRGGGMLQGSPHGSLRQDPHFAYAPTHGDAPRIVDGSGRRGVGGGGREGFGGGEGTSGVSCALATMPPHGEWTQESGHGGITCRGGAGGAETVQGQGECAESSPLGSGYVAGGGLNFSADDAVLLAHLRAGVRESGHSRRSGAGVADDDAHGEGDETRGAAHKDWSSTLRGQELQTEKQGVLVEGKTRPGFEGSDKGDAAVAGEDVEHQQGQGGGAGGGGLLPRSISLPMFDTPE